MDEIARNIRHQAKCASVDAVRVAVMLHEGYSDREVRAVMEIDNSTLQIYKTWIANAITATSE